VWSFDIVAVVAGLMRLPLKVLLGVVEGSGLVREERLAEMYLSKNGDEGVFEADYSVQLVYTGPGVGPSDELRHTEVHGEGAEQRVAVAYLGNFTVTVINAESGECVAKAGSALSAFNPVFCVNC
jgi:hypothetical protein